MSSVHDTAAEIVRRVLADEGGIRDVGDGKGVTMFGQTQGWLRHHGYPEPTTQAEAMTNYLRWLQDTGLIAVCAVVPDPFAHAVIDWAVHAGEGRAIKGLQSALGVRADGRIGPMTRAAIASADRGVVARKILGQRLRHVGILITDDPDRNAKYAKNWMRRIAAQVEAS